MNGANYVSCPTAQVNAPIEVVWEVLTHPLQWDNVFDLRVKQVKPKGVARAGQLVVAESGEAPLVHKVTLKFLKLDVAKHRIVLEVSLPFGISVREDMHCLAVGKTKCTVFYNCDFTFPGGLKGQLLKASLSKELEAGPKESILRLKGVAESKYKKR